ncbi:hypothetical protein, partial [Peribacillus muralis]|uniref:hypothetical protein n=1 Tax=Peribacillus muralis TaxID=264697 RepID=UPI00366E1558
KWNETEGARLLREMRVYLRPRKLKAEEAQGPPAERERLKCNETFIVQTIKNAMEILSSFSTTNRKKQKTVYKLHYYLSLYTV